MTRTEKIRRPARRGAALALIGALAVVGGPLAAVPAHADDYVYVYPDSIGTVDVSADPGTPWDRNPGAAQSAYATAAFTPADLPSSGTAPWKLDIEDKPLGVLEAAEEGIVLGVTASPATKARAQYYVGTGGYPAIDAQAPTLASLLAQPLSWDQTLVSGATTYGVTLQIQLQKEVAPGDWARVTVVSRWDPGTGVRDLGAGLWFANTDIHADGFLTGPKVNNRQSGPGVSPGVLLANFGDFQVVSFGPNLGRDGLDYVYTIQDFRVLGQQFIARLVPPSPGEPVPGSPPPPAPSLPTDPDTPPPAPSATGWNGDPVVPPSVSAAPVEPGASIPVSFAAGTFQPFEWVQFVFYSTPSYAASLQADATGALTGSVPVPDSVPGGSHTLAATGFTSGVVVTAAVTVAALAATGLDPAQGWLVGALGGALVLWGVVIMLALGARSRVSERMRARDRSA